MVRWCLLVVCATVAGAPPASAQESTGTLVGVVRDEQGAFIPDASIRLISPSLAGESTVTSTDARGRFRFRALPPGAYALGIDAAGFVGWRETELAIGVGQTIERNVVLGLASLAERVVVEGTGPRLEARSSGFETRFDEEYLRGIPVRRFSVFDFIKLAPGISPTAPSSGTDDRVSAFGSSTNENAFLIDGTNFTCPCSGNALAEPGLDMVQEIQLQSVGASAEFGNVQGGVFNIITRQGGNRFQADLSYYGQSAGMTSRPLELECPDCGGARSGYTRARYRDLTADAGGPVVSDRLWLFTGGQYLRNDDSQPGTDPSRPRVYELASVSWKVTWQARQGLRVVHTFSDQHSVAPERPTLALPYESTLRLNTAVPATTLAHVTHVLSTNTLWDARIGRMAFSQSSTPAAGDQHAANRVDRVTGVSSGGPQTVGHQVRIRTTGKATMTHASAPFAGIGQEWKFGAQVEKGEHSVSNRTPTGVRYVDSRGQPFQAVYREPVVAGGAFVTTGLFVTDAVAAGTRTTINVGLRFDHTRAFGQDLRVGDSAGRETGVVIVGGGTLYTWNVFSPRLGVTTKLTDDGRTILRTSYGRFHQGVLTAELQPVHPGVTPITTMAFDPATGGYSREVSVVDPKVNVRVDSGTRSPRTDEFSVSVERELGRGVTASAAYVRKAGRDFTGWTETAGQYREELHPLPDGASLPVSVLITPANDRRFVLTNPDGYSLTYNGLVVGADARAAGGWHLSGSYTLSRTAGLLVSSGSGPGGAQVSSVTGPTQFGRDPNTLTNARGLLPADRPHMVRVMGRAALPRTGLVVAGNLQYYSGTPWAASAQISLPQGDQRILIEPRGSRRMTSQTLLDVRVSRAFRWGPRRIELLADVLNLLNSTAPLDVATDNFFSPNFGRPTVFVDPRRVMVAVRATLGHP